jgi:very-short-patch-repair endonuclease
VEEKIAGIATRAHGVVTRGGLLRAGISDDEIKQRLRTGSLIREYPGVYRVGHRAPSVEALYLSAVFACGEGAVLSGRPAGYLLRLVKGSAPPPEVITPTERRIPGMETRRSRHIDRRDVTHYRGIPITTVARTLVDLAPDLTLDELARACHEAGALHRTTPRQVESVLARRPNSPGARRLRTVIRGEVHVVLSKLERRFLKLLRNERLPLPVTNRPAGTYRVDCRWPEHQLTVELDSYRYHNSSYSWKQSYKREREARARGDEFRRYTWDDVHEDSRDMLRELRQLLR